jgi:sigma-B regulation protein RsbU (phosphoserine phosphatase)
MKILIAEDDTVSRRLLAKTLQNWDHEVLAASDGAEARKLFLENPDLQFVISDWMMPELTGPELVKEIRGQMRDFYVYVILLTAKSEMDDLVRGMEAGADDFLTKPFDSRELRLRIAAAQRILDLEATLSRQNAHMRRDLNAAGAVQKSLLPEAPPAVEGFGFAWEFVPSEFVAGDILNIHRLDESKIGLYVLDVSGHGVPSAMLSVTLSRILEPIPGRDAIVKRWLPTPPHYEVISPGEVLSQLNQRFPMESQNNLYHTAIYGVLDTKARTFTLARSGHPEPILIRDGSAEVLKVEGGLPAGMFPDAEYPETVVQLQQGDRIHLYSDGLIEANLRGTEGMIGVNGLAEVLLSCRDLPLDESLRTSMKKLRDAVDEQGFDDDLTLLAVEVV